MNYYLAIFYKETTISFKGKKILTALTVHICITNKIFQVFFLGQRVIYLNRSTILFSFSLNVNILQHKQDNFPSPEK